MFAIVALLSSDKEQLPLLSLAKATMADIQILPLMLQPSQPSTGHWLPKTRQHLLHH